MHTIMKDVEMSEPNNNSTIIYIQELGNDLRIRRSDAKLRATASLRFQRDIIFHRRFFSRQSIRSAYHA